MKPVSGRGDPGAESKGESPGQSQVTELEAPRVYPTCPRGPVLAPRDLQRCLLAQKADQPSQRTSTCQADSELCPRAGVFRGGLLRLFCRRWN